MQTIALLLPEPFATRVTEARALLAEDPALGSVLDPPFAHFTLQMADDYDWDGLRAALTEFVRGQAPIPIRTVGLLTVTGPSTGITLEPYRDDRLAQFHADFWAVATPFARGTVAPFYLPDRWVPHVTIKRCGPHRDAFGHALARLSDETFLWTMQVEALNVQHDPDNNNQTRYQRLLLPLGDASAPRRSTAVTNATITAVTEAETNGQPRWTALARVDDGSTSEATWRAPDAVRLMAAARAPLCYFRGARCRVDDGVISAIEAVTPTPLDA